MVTIAVQRTLQAEDRAERILCSTDRARRMMHSGEHDTARFSDLDPDAAIPAAVEHTAATLPPDHALEAGHAPGSGSELVSDGVAGGVRPSPLEARIGLITVRTVMLAAGWPADVTAGAVEYVCERLGQSKDTSAAFEHLRRDMVPLGGFDLTHRGWVALCRVLLGEPGRPGLLERAIIGQRPVDLLADARLLRDLQGMAPRVGVRHG
ncbi:hypothetical protein [Myceligenerans pegani]|uniref:hypothetical protein n=1 Tax=Myceligenerans pegani TaxID=2776917 RepID=UPI001865E01A|nr:hypothetical protein [Myceligenerans sp. TRM 65318]MBE3021257.1 hypothetical protein [Myceligenerans sp. TRM 65318]